MRLRRSVLSALSRRSFPYSRFLPPSIDTCLRMNISIRKLFLTAGCLFLLLFTTMIAPWPVSPPSVVFAASSHQPKLSPPAWLKPRQKHTPPPAAPYHIVQPGKPDTYTPVAPSWPVTMKPLSIKLTAQAAQNVSSDGRLEVSIPAGSIDAAQLQAAGGSLTLTITQLLPGSGGRYGSEITFGTYQLLVRTATGGGARHLTLLHPITLLYHLQKDQAALVWSGQKVYAVLRGGDASTLLPGAKPSVPAQDEPPTTSTLLYAQQISNSLTWRVQTNLTIPATASSTPPALSPPTTILTPTATPKSTTKPTASPTVTPTPAATPRSAAKPTATATSTPTVPHPSSPSSFAITPSTVTFGTQAPQALWGTPTQPQVDLNSGQVTYTYPLDLPPGPGGLTPTLNLAYSSGSVDESHNLQAGAPWVGTGWNLSMGSITWSQENVTPGGTNHLENIWQFNDPNGISGQLIPPSLSTSTLIPYSPALSNLGTNTVWHTSPDNHARIIEVPSYNGSYPCFRAYFPDGTMEEFGCYDDDAHGTDQSFKGSDGNWDRYRWDIDLIVDRYGNQIHFTYQRIWNSKGTAVQDAVLSSISYDDPSCHQQTVCTTWNPRITIGFDAGTSVNASQLLNSPCQNWSNSKARCDNPVDLSGSGGLPAPEVMNSFVLNDVKVEVSGNLLRQYTFYYTQLGPQTITDPASGQSESISGYLNLDRIQEQGVNNTSPSAPAPLINLTYAVNHLHYDDEWSYATPVTNCSPDSWMPKDGNGDCYLWSRTTQTWYLVNIDNGQDWNESFTWTEAHNNTHGVDSGAIDNPTTCNSIRTSSNRCGKADDKNWSHYVITQKVLGGSSPGWTYDYWLQTGLKSNYVGAICDECGQGFTWGNQNDDDYADYYNGQFESFAKVQVNQPDSSSQLYLYDTMTGWGLAEPGFTCYISQCQVAPYFTNQNSLPPTALAGKEIEEDDYNFQDSGTLLAVKKWTWDANCKPGGFGVSGGGPPNNPGDQYLISQLDQNNPVVVCDPRATQEDDYTLDGVTTNLSDPRVVHKTTSYSYDTSNKSGISGYDYGNLSKIDESDNYPSPSHIITTQTYYPNDNIAGGLYLIDLPAYTQTQDGSGTPYACSQAIYGSNTTPSTWPTLPDVTQAQSYSVAGSGGCTGTNNLITVLHTYDASGNAITAIDGDGHLGCTENGNQYSACAVYDSAATHILTATNALNQATTYTYATDATGGFGEWLTAETDPNTQTTQYQYDVLGRLTAIARPGDSLGSPTVSYTYTNTCSQGQTTPCLELDTSTQFVSGDPPSTMKQWYDGYGNLVETQTPSPEAGQTIVTFTSYDFLERPIIKSLPYTISTPLGFVNPDWTQPRIVTGYDALGRSQGTTTYGQGSNIVTENTINYTIGNSIPTLGGDTNPYEQTITVDALNHQSITYTDAFGRTRYTQVFSGTNTPYSVVRTVGYTYDPLGDDIETVTYDHTGTAQAVYTATYDALKERTGYTDPDLGTWGFNYDADGNLVAQYEADSQPQFNRWTSTSYDALDRPLCEWETYDFHGSCQTSSLAEYFYDSYNNTSNPSLTFPSSCTAPGGSYASDPIGHVTAEVFGGGSTGSGWYCYGYDQRGETDQQSLSVTTPDKQTLTQTMNMSYDDGGELSTLVYPNGQALTTQYDANGRAQSVYFGTSSTPDPVNFLVGQVNYTPWGQLAGMAMGGSGPKASPPTNTLFSTALGYDVIQRPLSISATMSGQTQAFFSQARTYDAIGNVTQLLTTIPTSGGGTKNDNQSYCYDDLSRLVWNGNNGTPTGGDDCGSAPTGTTIAYHHQAYSYDDLDRMTSGREGTYTYGDTSSIHAVTNLSDVPNQYAAYDAFSDMICQNTDTTSAHTCSGSNPTGATMSYDYLGHLLQWTAPSGTTASDSFLYDGEGNRVLQSASSTVNGTTTVTDTITFDGYTESTITGGTTTTINYYSLGGQRVALQQGNNPVTYLISDLLGSVDVAVNAGGAITAVQLYWPYGEGEFSWGTMPTTYNFTGQRLDSVTGLLYYNARYYDPFSARFTTADTVENNANGMDPYAYVGDDPVGKKDPTGHDGHDDPEAAEFVEEWYMELEGTYGILIDQPSDTHNPAIAISNAAVPGWDSSENGLRNLMQNMPGLIAQGGTSGKGYPDIMNTYLHLIYEVKGGEPQPDGSTNFPSNLTVAYGWAQARWYAAMANQDPRWNQGGSWTVGNLQADRALEIVLDICGGSCVYPMGSRWIMITYAGRGVLTYQVFTSEPTDKVSPKVYPQLYLNWQKLLGSIAMAYLVSMAMGGGYNAGSSSTGLALASAWGGGGCSFSANTMVWTPDGEVPIGQLQIDDQVLAYNPLMHVLEAQPILHVWEHEDADLVDVSIMPTMQSSVLFAGTPEVIHTTSKHPFLTVEEGFIPVSQLRIGMHVMQANGSVGIVTAIRPVSEGVIMYNLEVAQDHTFIVGDDQWIVHNTCL